MEQFQFGEPLGARESQPAQQSALETVKWSSSKFDATQLNKQIHFSDCSSTPSVIVLCLATLKKESLWLHF